MSTRGIEIQDASGNVYYPHTDASLVRYDNDNNVKQKIDNINTDLNDKANPSILINGNFRNPINQRGFTSRTYTGNNWAYGIDRWFVGIIDSNNQSECILNNGYISLKSKANDGNVGTYTLLENPKSFVGKTLTASFKYRIVEGDPNSFEIISYNNLSINGTFYKYSDDSNRLIADGSWHNHSFTFKVSENIVDDPFTSFLISTGNLKKTTNDYVWEKPTMDCQIDIEWIKLEYGNKATPFYPRLYAEELALCQRYYEQIYLPNIARMDTGYVIRASYKVFKRTTPTFVYKSIDGTIGKLSYYDTDKWTDIDVLNNDWSNSLGYSFQFPGSGIDRDLFINGVIVADAEIY